MLLKLQQHMYVITRLSRWAPAQACLGFARKDIARSIVCINTFRAVVALQSGKLPFIYERLVPEQETSTNIPRLKNLSTVPQQTHACPPSGGTAQGPPIPGTR